MKKLIIFLIVLMILPVVSAELSLVGKSLDFLKNTFCELTGCDITGEVNVSGTINVDQIEAKNINISNNLNMNSSNITGIVLLCDSTGQCYTLSGMNFTNTGAWTQTNMTLAELYNRHNWTFDYTLSGWKLGNFTEANSGAFKIGNFTARQVFIEGWDKSNATTYYDNREPFMIENMTVFTGELWDYTNYTAVEAWNKENHTALTGQLWNRENQSATEPWDLTNATPFYAEIRQSINDNITADNTSIVSYVDTQDGLIRQSILDNISTDNASIISYVNSQDQDIRDNFINETELLAKELYNRGNATADYTLFGWKLSNFTIAFTNAYAAVEAWELSNFTTAFDNREVFMIANFTEEYAKTGAWDYGNMTAAELYNRINWTADYTLSGWKKGNFTAAYDAREPWNLVNQSATMPYDKSNFTGDYNARDSYDRGNFSSDYTLEGYDKSNFTTDYDAREPFNNDNYSALEPYDRDNWTEDYTLSGWNWANNDSDKLGNLTILRFPDNESYINATIDARTASITYLPNNVTTVEGTLDGGDINSLRIIDNLWYNVSEDSGGSPLLIDINFTEVVTFSTILLRTWYSGGQGHEIEIQTWNYDASAWEGHGDITDQSTMTELVVDVLDSSDHVQGGVVKLRFDHQQNGNAGHDFYIDYAVLQEGFTSITTAEHDGLLGRDNECTNHPWVCRIIDNNTIVRVSNLSGWDENVADDWNLGNYTATAPYDKSNFTTDFDDREVFKIGNFTVQYALAYTASEPWELANFTGAFIGADANFTTLNVSGDVLIAGNVGIGTTTPNFKLDVVGTINATAVNATKLCIGDSCMTVIPTTTEGYWDLSNFTTAFIGANANFTTLNTTGNITFTQLKNCNTIDTDANGVLTCGTDDSAGAPEGLWNQGNMTASALYNRLNWSNDYTLSGYKKTNFTTDYNAKEPFNFINLTARVQGSNNISIEVVGGNLIISVNTTVFSGAANVPLDSDYNRENFSSDYTLSGFKKGNMTEFYPNLDIDSTDDYATSDFTTDYNARQPYDRDNWTADYTLSGWKLGNFTTANSGAFKIGNFSDEYAKTGAWNLGNASSVYTCGNGCSIDGSQVVTVAGGTCLTQDGSGLSVTGNCIDDTQLTFNTGQPLTVTSGPTFAGLNITGNNTFDGTINQTIVGIVRQFSNNCFEIANSSGIYTVC